jgi:hypothetical protein
MLSTGLATRVAKHGCFSPAACSKYCEVVPVRFAKQIARGVVRLISPIMLRKPCIIPLQRMSWTFTPASCMRRAYASPSSRKTSNSAVTTSAGASPPKSAASSGETRASGRSLGSGVYCFRNLAIIEQMFYNHRAALIDLPRCLFFRTLKFEYSV